jgi:aldehyde dehydrogenase (NAD+)
MPPRREILRQLRGADRGLARGLSRGRRHVRARRCRVSGLDSAAGATPLVAGDCAAGHVAAGAGRASAGAGIDGLAAVAAGAATGGDGSRNGAAGCRGRLRRRGGRADHRMMETWHPLGVCGVISAFNFPVAVWSWNAALAFVCGDPVVWKPSEKTPLTALATQAVVERAMRRFGNAPDGLSAVVIGGRDIGQAVVADTRVAVVSATGSTAMGRDVGPRLAARFARAILEFGGNNAAIVAPSADLHLAVRAIAFAAMGTAGQRCTTLRRLFVHDNVYDRIVPRLSQIYASVKVGDPREAATLVGPLIDRRAFESMQRALEEAREAGGILHGGERIAAIGSDNANYVRPALCEMPGQTGPVLRETFAPILYVMRYSELDEAIRSHNAVGAGLSSSIFTLDVREAERFVSMTGSGRQV